MSSYNPDLHPCPIPFWQEEAFSLEKSQLLSPGIAPGSSLKPITKAREGGTVGFNHSGPTQTTWLSRGQLWPRKENGGWEPVLLASSLLVHVLALAWPVIPTIPMSLTRLFSNATTCQHHSCPVHPGAVPTFSTLSQQLASSPLWSSLHAVWTRSHKAPAHVLCPK